MKANQSPISLQNFAVLQSHYDFIKPSRTPKDVKKIFKSYELDIDFAHHFEEDGTIHVFVKITVNNISKPLYGYKFLVEGAGIFQLKEADISDSEKKNLKFYSTVSILIGYLRNTIISLSSSGPFGSYILPPIDMADLFNKKSEQSKA